MKILVQINKYKYEQIARFVQRFASTACSAARIIDASSDMGNPSVHSTGHVPTLLFGGVNGRFRMGRCLRVAYDCPENNEWYEYTAISNNRLLVSVAQALGVEIDAFGTQPKGARRVNN